MRCIARIIPWLLLCRSLILAASSQPGPSSADKLEGRILEVIHTAGYSYLLLDTGRTKVWTAAPELKATAGDQATITGALPMANYRSRTLNRTFDVVYFASDVQINGRAAAGASGSASLPPGHPPTSGSRTAPAAEASPLTRAPGGQTVAEIHAGSAALAGKTVTVRARVVKFNGGILGRNWLHVRDGSGTEGTNDLTVTSADAAKVGDVVLVTGKVALKQDFGSGYRYPLLVQEAKIKVE